MGIYSYNLRTILEVKRKINGKEEDLDDQEQDDIEQEPEQEDETQDDNDRANDYNMDLEEEPEDDGNTDSEEPEDDGNTDSEEPEQDDETQDDNNRANDYNMDLEQEPEDEDTGNVEDEDSNTTDDETSEDSGDELKTLEDDIFKDISQEQMNIKIMELKKQYIEVHSTITDVLGRINKIPKTSQNMSVLEFCINKLMELKEFVQFYLSNTFDTKTYVENMVNYQQYLATLNTINRLLKEISRKKENNT